MKTLTTVSIIILAIIFVGAGAYVMSHRKGDEDAVSKMASATSLPEEKTRGMFVQTAPSTTPESSDKPSTTSQDPVIEMTDNGFSPAELTITSGTTVTFINKGQALHWPASDPHPIHTDLSGFDAKRGLESGDIYRFTFEKIGTFGMHDHLDASFKGVVTVK